MPKKIKEIIYEITAGIGVNILKDIFPEYFNAIPLKLTDRYIEYNFAIRNLPKPPAKILDVGCAGSFFPLLLAGFGYDTYGLDIREYAILNRIGFPNFVFVRENIKHTSFPDNYFDAVTAISTIEHIGISGRYGITERESEDIQASEEIKRVTKSKGVILLTLPFGVPDIIRPYMRVYGKERVKSLMNGLEIEEIKYYMQDTKDDWYERRENEVLTVRAKPGRYPLCLLKARKK